MCSFVVVKYSEVITTILVEAARRKSFVHDSANDAYIVQGSADRPNNRGRSSPQPPTNQGSRSKSQDIRICNYCKKPGHIKADCRTLKAKNDKAQ